MVGKKLLHLLLHFSTNAPKTIFNVPTVSHYSAPVFSQAADELCWAHLLTLLGLVNKRLTKFHQVWEAYWHRIIALALQDQCFPIQAIDLYQSIA